MQSSPAVPVTEGFPLALGAGVSGRRGCLASVRVSRVGSGAGIAPPALIAAAVALPGRRAGALGADQPAAQA